MERIVFRAIIVLSVVGLLLGVPSIYLGTKGIENWPKTLEVSSAEIEARLKECLANPKQHPEPAQCHQAYQLELSIALTQESEGYSSAANLQTFGIVAAILLPPTLLILFYILRWIFTGRWRFVPLKKSGASR